MVCANSGRRGCSQAKLQPWAETAVSGGTAEGHRELRPYPGWEESVQTAKTSFEVQGIQLWICLKIKEMTKICQVWSNIYLNY